jgi:hypothetical protein
MFDGITYEPTLDQDRLASQLERVAALMADGRWRTLDEIVAECGGTAASISARLRDFRKVRFGAHQVDRRRIGHGLFEYRLVWKAPCQLSLALRAA